MEQSEELIQDLWTLAENVLSAGRVVVIILGLVVRTSQFSSPFPLTNWTGRLDPRSIMCKIQRF